MPLYMIKLSGGGPTGGATESDHGHRGWEVPVQQDATRRLFKVTKGNFLPDLLDVRISAAEPEGEEGYTLVFPPAYVETDPSKGLFTLAQQLPDDWILEVRYAHT